MRQHLALCAPCRRFDAAFRAGVDTLRGLPSLAVSRGFSQRLRNRLRLELASRVPMVNRWAGAAGALLVIATVGVVGWDLAEMHERGKQTIRTVAAGAALQLADTPATPELLRRDSAEILSDALHPLLPIMVVADTHVALSPDHPRFDIPASWGGR